MTPKSLRVLVLEDREEDLELILRTLRKAGYAPIWKRVESEVEYRAALTEGWDVILSDYSVPQFDAPHALAVLQELGFDTPFLVITGSISEDVAVACMKQGAADYLLKDRLVRLGAAVGQALEAREARRERQETESALRLTQHAVDHSPVAMLRTDLVGRITYANLAARDLLGYSADALLQLSIDDVDQNSARPDWPGSATELRQAGATKFESTYRRHDQSTLPVEVAASYLEFAGEDRLFYFVADISQRKQSAALLLESEKMRTVAGLAAGMAHEINNPLAGVMQSAQVVLTRINPENDANRQAAQEAGTTIEVVRDYMDRRRIPEMLEAVRASGQRAADIVHNMLSFSRTRDVELTAHPIDRLLDRTVELAQSDNAFRRIAVVREYEPGMPAVVCQAAEVQQVLLNLLRNASHAMLATTAPRITLRTRRDGEMARVEVEDNGPGMPPEVRDRAFEPFFTTKPTGEGTGLGLYVSYFIVTENHGGTMAVESEAGRGARFVIRLPIRGKG